MGDEDDTDCWWIIYVSVSIAAATADDDSSVAAAAIMLPVLRAYDSSGPARGFAAGGRTEFIQRIPLF